jgi:hypothetical protein
MLICGAAMYLISRYQAPPGEYDMLTIENKDTSISRKVRLYAAIEPTEIFYADGTWLKADSTPLKLVLDRSNLNFMSKQYSSVALVLTYNNSWFYDLQFDKPDPSLAYEISFKLEPVGDTLYVKGVLDNNDGEVIRFGGPMIRMYKQFILTYNNKMPPPPPDSLEYENESDSLALAHSPQPNKTITILEN